MTRTPRPGRRAGFTLIELLVVVVIIGILASIAMPSFAAAQDKARNAKAASAIGVVRQAFEGYMADNNGSCPLNADLLSTTAGLGAHRYLPGNRLPLSPWSSQPQTLRLGGTDLPFMCVEWLDQNGVNGAVPVVGKTPAQYGATAWTGAAGVPAPTLKTHYGAIITDTEDSDAGNDRTRYAINVVGKRGKACILAGWASNAGN